MSSPLQSRQTCLQALGGLPATSSQARAYPDLVPRAQSRTFLVPRLARDFGEERPFIAQQFGGGVRTTFPFYLGFFINKFSGLCYYADLMSAGNSSFTSSALRSAGNMEDYARQDHVLAGAPKTELICDRISIETIARLGSNKITWTVQGGRMMIL